MMRTVSPPRASSRYRQLRPPPAPLRILKRHWPLAVACIVLWAAIGVLLILTLRATDGLLLYADDEAYLHMAVGRNLVQAAVWGIDGGHFAPASTSPLWCIVLAVTYLIGGVREAVPLGLNVILATAFIAATYKVLRAHEFRPGFIVAGLLAAMAATSLPALVLRGSEQVALALLVVLFTSAAVRALRREIEGDDMRQRELAAATMGALTLAPLLVLTHRDGIFPVATAAVLLLTRRRWTDGLLMTAAGMAPLLLCGVFSATQSWPVVWQPLALAPAGGDSVLTLGAIGAALLCSALGRRNVFTLRRAAYDWLTLLAVTGIGLMLDGRGGAAAQLACVGALAVPALCAPLQTGVRLSDAALQPLRITGGVMAVLMVPLCAAGVQRMAGLLPATRASYLLDYQAARFAATYYRRKAIMADRAGMPAFYSHAVVVDRRGRTDAILAEALQRRPQDQAALAEVAQRRHGEFALAENAGHLPPAWMPVARWSAAGKTLTFFAVTPESGTRLLANLRHFKASLPPELRQSAP